MRKYLALVLLVGLGIAFAPSCKKEKKHAPKKVHRTHQVKKHKKGGIKVQDFDIKGVPKGGFQGVVKKTFGICNPPCGSGYSCKGGGYCVPNNTHGAVY